MKKIHKTQQAILDLLKVSMDDPCTLREIQLALNISSPSIVHHHITQLEKKGYLKRNPNNPKDYEIIADGPEKKVTYLNLYGPASCGPSGTLLDGDPVDRIPISTKLIPFAAKDAFMMEAIGKSMEPRIRNRDLVIVKRNPQPDDGSIVVCVNRGEVMIKRYTKGKSKVMLTSLNPDVRPFEAEEDFHIEGEVKSIISTKVL